VGDTQNLVAVGTKIDVSLAQKAPHILVVDCVEGDVAMRTNGNNVYVFFDVDHINLLSLKQIMLN